MIQNNGLKLIAINGVSDHVHILIGMKPNQSLSDLVQDIKGDSAKWVNEQKFATGKFQWQSGFGAFSYSYSQIDTVVRYIDNQEMHHRKKTFSEEYLDFLEKFHVPFDERYIFNDVM